MCDREWVCLIKHLGKNSGRGSEANISIKGKKEEEAGHRKHAGIRSRKGRCPGTGKNRARSQDGKGVNRGKLQTVGASHSLARHSQAPTFPHSNPVLPVFQRHRSGAHQGFSTSLGCSEVPHTWALQILHQAKPHDSKFPYGPYCLHDFADGVSAHPTALSVCLSFRPQETPAIPGEKHPRQACIRVGFTLCFRRLLSGQLSASHF